MQTFSFRDRKTDRKTGTMMDRNSVSHKDQLKGSLGPSIEILKGPFSNFKGPNPILLYINCAPTLSTSQGSSYYLAYCSSDAETTAVG